MYICTCLLVLELYQRRNNTLDFTLIKLGMRGPITPYIYIYKQTYTCIYVPVFLSLSFTSDATIPLTLLLSNLACGAV